MKKSLQSFLIISILLFWSFFILLPVLAAPAPSSPISSSTTTPSWLVKLPDFSKLNFTRFKSWDEIVKGVAEILIGFSGLVFIIMFFVGGVQYLTSGGNEEQSGKAKKTLVYAVVGLLVVLSAYAIMNFITKIYEPTSTPVTSPTLPSVIKTK